KFSLSDLKERGFWDHYQTAYEKAISETSTENAPWFIIPADNKWFARLAIASVIYRYFDKLKMQYPIVTEGQKAELQRAKLHLMAEKDDSNGKPKSKKKSKKRPAKKKTPVKRKAKTAPAQ
ncbi:MAG TPA: polyphosphate--nucleotide phosphotransferase, partial [Cytophagales bacterium]|nr:polyphosphate--nucleotide phosphotransferase [Cytophagales bacterium]